MMITLLEKDWQELWKKRDLMFFKLRVYKRVSNQVKTKKPGFAVVDLKIS